MRYRPEISSYLLKVLYKIQVIPCTMPTAHHTQLLCVFWGPLEDRTKVHADHVNRWEVTASRSSLAPSVLLYVFDYSFCNIAQELLRPAVQTL